MWPLPNNTFAFRTGMQQNPASMKRWTDQWPSKPGNSSCNTAQETFWPLLQPKKWNEEVDKLVQEEKLASQPRATRIQDKQEPAPITYNQWGHFEPLMDGCNTSLSFRKQMHHTNHLVANVGPGRPFIWSHGLKQSIWLFFASAKQSLRSLVQIWTLESTLSAYSGSSCT